MKPLTVILLFSTILFSATLNQKIIIDVTTEPQPSTDILQKIENFFQTNSLARSLQSKNHLTITLKKLKGYDLIEIKPVSSIEVKNRLKFLLHKEFPQFFVVDDTFRKKSMGTTLPVTAKPKHLKALHAEKQKCTSSSSVKNESKGYSTSLIKGIVDEWLALIILAIAGLLLVYRSARQISKIKKLQKKLEKYQNRLKTEVDVIGGQYE